jgi:hypothetical protein
MTRHVEPAGDDVVSRRVRSANLRRRPMSVDRESVSADRWCRPVSFGSVSQGASTKLAVTSSDAEHKRLAARWSASTKPSSRIRSARAARRPSSNGRRATRARRRVVRHPRPRTRTPRITPERAPGRSACSPARRPSSARSSASPATCSSSPFPSCAASSPRTQRSVTSSCKRSCSVGSSGAGRPRSWMARGGGQRRWRTEKTAPSGSLSTAMRPTSARSKGATDTVPPSWPTRLTISSVSATAK